MNYYNKILNYLILVLTFITSSFCQNLDEDDITISLTLLNTGWFTLTSWTNSDPGNVNIELWTVNIENKTDVEQQYRIYYQLKGGDEIKSAGLSPVEIIQGNSGKEIYSNNPLFTDPFYLDDWYGDEFEQDVRDLGHIPPGSYYELTLAIVKHTYESIQDIQSEYEFIDFAVETMQWQLGEQFSIEYPNDGQVFPGGGNFYFQWDTPGFRSGVKVEFRLKISAIIPEDADSPEDAIEFGPNDVFYFDSEWSELPISGVWPYVETGLSNALNSWYLILISETGMEQLECGFDYAWRMDAREIIDAPPFNGEGIWGWPEPVKSEVRKFTWGNPTGFISPEGDDVLPSFIWDIIGCAEDGFDIQISPIEEDFSEGWETHFITPPFQYPADEPGLIPGKVYKWRVRVHSLTGGTNWSEPEIFTINEIELIGPQIGEIVESVRPYFNINPPANISHYELLIGDVNDEYVEQVEVYNREQEIKTWPWQYPAQNIENGLYPGMLYYWKLLMFDGSGNILGDIEDYGVMGNFRVMPIILTEPSNAETNIPLNQKFTWDGPLSVPSYEFWLSDIDDPDVESPKINMNITGSKSFDYPEDSDFPLENEKSYYWKIVPKDINDNYGLPSSYSMVYQFTALDFPVMGEDLSVSNSDVRIPIINIETSEGIKYTIFIYGDPDGSTIIEEISGITNFPYEYSDGKETLQYGTTYYIQVQPVKNGENFGPPSNMLQ